MEFSRGRPAGRAPIGSPIVTAPSDEVLTAGASGAGLATVTADGVVLDVWYPAPRLTAEAGSAERPHRIRWTFGPRSERTRSAACACKFCNTTIATWPTRPPIPRTSTCVCTCCPPGWHDPER